MRVYQVVWWTVCIVVAAPAIAVTYLVGPPTTGVTVSVALSCVCMSWFVVFVAEFSGRPVRLADCARICACGGFALIAAVSLFHVMGEAGLAVLALAAGTSPLVIRTMRRRGKRACTRRRDHQFRFAVDAVDQDNAWDELLAELLTQMTDVDLCWAWRTSYCALFERPDPDWRTRVAGVRHAYLLELERRHPQQLEKWLATSPRPATGPERFIRLAADGDAPPG